MLVRPQRPDNHPLAVTFEHLFSSFAARARRPVVGGGQFAGILRAFARATRRALGAYSFGILCALSEREAGDRRELCRLVHSQTPTGIETTPNSRPISTPTRPRIDTTFNSTLNRPRADSVRARCQGAPSRTLPSMLGMPTRVVDRFAGRTHSIQLNELQFPWTVYVHLIESYTCFLAGKLECSSMTCVRSSAEIKLEPSVCIQPGGPGVLVGMCHLCGRFRSSVLAQLVRRSLCLGAIRLCSGRPRICRA